MCGLSFYCSLQSNPFNELKKSMLEMNHRGPDDSGVLSMKIADYHLGVGHNRLSILDLSEAGKQPMDLGHGVIISYNGEVYNHKPLRTLLEKKGYAFKGHSDTEIVSLLYTEYGEASFSMLKGMFALVIIDKNKQKVWMARDRLGIKPLYVYSDAQSLYASSEIRGLKAFSAVPIEIDRHDVFEFFNQGFLYEPSTGYVSIQKLKPGHSVEIDLRDGSKKEIGFQTSDDYYSNANLEDVIQSAVKQQLTADVPLGTFFSGGIDSSIIAHFAENNDLFFAKYTNDEQTDLDLSFSKKISTFLNKPLHISEISHADESADEIMRAVDFVAKNTEELISDYTFWPTYQLSQAAREKGYKVMLSGMGADEIFAGYPRYSVLKHHSLIKSIRPVLKGLLRLKWTPKKWDKKFDRLVSYTTEKHWPTAYSRLLGYFSRAELNDFFSDMDALTPCYQSKLDEIAQSYEGQGDDKVKLAQHYDLKGFLSHNLMVSDKASMLAGLELRVPLLDESIVHHGMRLSSKSLLKKGQLKHPLKTLLRRLLPEHFVERPKVGFNPPLEGLINALGKERLQSEMVHVGAFINLNAVNSLITQHFAGEANNVYKLWQLLYFSRWLKLQGQNNVA